jgi:hypothetical protein
VKRFRMGISQSLAAILLATTLLGCSQSNTPSRKGGTSAAAEPQIASATTSNTAAPTTGPLFPYKVDGKLLGLSAFGSFVMWNSVRGEGRSGAMPDTTTLLNQRSGRIKLFPVKDPNAFVSLAVGARGKILQRESQFLPVSACKEAQAYDCGVWKLRMTDIQSGSSQVIAQSETPAPQIDWPSPAAGDGYFAWQVFNRGEAVTQVFNISTGDLSDLPLHAVASQLSISSTGRLIYDDVRNERSLTVANLRTGSFRVFKSKFRLYRVSQAKETITALTGDVDDGMRLVELQLSSKDRRATVRRVLRKSSEIYFAIPLSSGGAVVSEVGGIRAVGVRGKAWITRRSTNRLAVVGNKFVYSLEGAASSTIRLVDLQ